MSYCHLLGGCVAGQTNRVFHPGSAAVIQPLVRAAVGQCVFPLFTVSAIAPKAGPTGGGTPVTITGAGFEAGATVTFAGVPASNVVVADSSTISAQSPAPTPSETVTVTVMNPVLESGAVDYFYAPDPVQSDFYSVDPCRILDTREIGQGPALAAGQARVVQVAGVCGIPDDAGSISANVTVVGPGAGGHLSSYPGNAPDRDHRHLPRRHRGDFRCREDDLAPGR